MNIFKVSTVKLFAVATIVSTVFFTSCNRDDSDEVNVAKPSVTKMEVGVHNSKVGYAGSDLHLAAEIEAAGKISTVEVEIHKEDGTGWKLNKVFDEFSGQLNTHFHKHIDIPANAELGEYHFHLIVKDMQGQETVFEEHLKVELSSDTQGPQATVNFAPTANQQFNFGESISITGKITDNNAVGGYLIALVRADDIQVSNTSVIIMDLKYFQDAQEVNFNSQINVGAQYDNQSSPALILGENAWESGDYYILVRTWDNVGNITETQKYPVKINL